MIVLVAALALGTGWLVARQLSGEATLLGQAPESAASTEGPVSPEEVLGYSVAATVDLGDGRILTVGPEAQRGREVALLQRDAAGGLTVVDRRAVPLRGDGLEAARQDLPGHPGAVVLTTRLSRGEPQYAAVAVTGAGLVALDYYALTAPPAPAPTGTALLVYKRLNVLYLYKDGKLVRTYRVATGSDIDGPPPTWADYMTNTFTPEGQFTITVKQVNPPFYGDATHPPAPGGAPENPLGTRWLGFQVLGPDDPGTIWGIHGTNEPESIGSWASNGCIRLLTPEVEELFDQVPEGTPLWIVPG